MHWLILFVGGGIGAILRFALALWVDQRAPVPFPWGTMAVNVTGCFAIGLIATFADEHHVLPAAVRLFLVAGLLGGFTTFSTFGLETLQLVDDGLVSLAVWNAIGSVVASLAAVVAGIVLARSLS